MARRKILFFIILFLCASSIEAGTAIAQKTNWRQIGSFPGRIFLSGHFWNSKTGVVGDGNQFLYTRDGRTWNTSSTSGIPIATYRLSMRCFDSKTVYAALLNNYGLAGGGVAELWSSTDSGATWVRIQQ
ncbi:MAG TPA: hypothetical protein VG537_07620, partial [Candidatus Kapabacteria bacterium]|nr:hypothetical protein [Candidatus Kapabacteria bacterium]